MKTYEEIMAEIERLNAAKIAPKLAPSLVAALDAKVEALTWVLKG